MASIKVALPLALFLPVAVCGCGLYTPEEFLFSNDDVPRGQLSPEGRFENAIVGHIKCELRQGIWNATVFPQVNAWLSTWGVAVTLKITVDEMSGLNPGASLLTPLENSVKAFPVGGNVVSQQNVSIGLGLSGTAHSTRLETIAFTYSVPELMVEARKELAAKSVLACDKLQNGVQINSNLKIGQFIYDKAVIAAVGEDTSKSITAPPFSTLTDDITFVASYGGSVTPVWHFARITVGNSTSLANATRTKTNEVIITFGPLASGATPQRQAKLSPDAQTVHNAALIGSATASSINSQTR